MVAGNKNMIIMVIAVVDIQAVVCGGSNIGQV